MAQMLQHSWFKCYYTIAVIKLTKATSQFPLETQPRGSAHCFLSHSPPNPANQTAVTPIVTAN